MSSRFHVCRDGDLIPHALQGAVVAIGNFDGVHRGHQHLIAGATDLGRQLGRPSAVLTFEPHPRLFFNPGLAMFRLTPEPVKIAVLSRFGLDGVFLRRFDAAFASLSAEAFVTKLLVEELGAAGAVAGPDFHFGFKREGTPARLEELCRSHGLACRILSRVGDDGHPVSSSAIRKALEQGEIALANSLLGYRWFVRAEVRHGDKRGRTLGFPTANLRLSEDNRLKHGIYAVRARSQIGIHGGVASFGRRPTFDNGAPLLEVHLFDFEGDLYGRTLDVEFLGRIRGEERFDRVEALVERMNADALEARAILAADATRSLLA